MTHILIVKSNREGVGKFRKAMPTSPFFLSVFFKGGVWVGGAEKIIICALFVGDPLHTFS